MSIFLENVDIESLDCYQLHLCVLKIQVNICRSTILAKMQMS